MNESLMLFIPLGGEGEAMLPGEGVKGISEAKAIWKDAAKMLTRDRLQANIGRVQQSEKESYQHLFDAFRNWNTLLAVNPGAPRIEIGVESSTVQKLVGALFIHDDRTLNELGAELHRQGALVRVSSNLMTLVNALNDNIAIFYGPQRRTEMPMAVVERTAAVSSGSFLARARDLENRGSLNKALDLVYASIDQWLRASRFDDVNSLLISLIVHDYSTDILLTLLTSTFPAKRRLPVRSKFFEGVRNELQKRGEDVDTLLIGLKD